MRIRGEFEEAPVLIPLILGSSRHHSADSFSRGILVLLQPTAVRLVRLRHLEGLVQARQRRRRLRLERRGQRSHHRPPLGTPVER